jgi:hypothetical protein
MEKDKSLLKNFAKFSIAGLILLGGVACKQESHKPVVTHGPSETGGGNVSRYSIEGIEEELKEVVLQHHNLLENYARAYHEWANGFMQAIEKNEEGGFFEVIGKVEGELPKVLSKEMFIQVSKKTKNGKSLMEAAKELDQPIIFSDQACEDSHGNKMEGSSKYKGRLCFSTYLMAKSSSMLDYQDSVRSLLMHELAHKAGLNEQEAKHIEVFFNFIGTKIDPISGEKSGIVAGIKGFLSSMEFYQRNFEIIDSNFNNRKDNFSRLLSENPILNIIDQVEENEFKGRNISEEQKKEFREKIESYLTEVYTENKKWVLATNLEAAVEYIYLSILDEPTRHLEPVSKSLKELYYTMRDYHRQAKINISNEIYEYSSDIHEVYKKIHGMDKEYLIEHLDISEENYSLSEKLKDDLNSLSSITRIVGDVFKYWDAKGSSYLEIVDNKYVVCEGDRMVNFDSVYATSKLAQSFCKSFPVIDLENNSRLKFLQDVTLWFEKELRPIQYQLEQEMFLEDVYDCLNSTVKECEENYEPNDQEYGKRIFDKANELRKLPVAPSLIKLMNKEIPNRK